MASVIQERRGKRVRYRIQFRDGDGKRKSIRLADANKRTADAICSKVEALNHCRIAGEPLSPALAEWVAGLGSELHGKLAAAGLVEPRQSSTLSGFMAHYVDSRKGDWAESTIYGFRQLERSLVGFLGADKDMRSVIEGDADDWRQSLNGQFAEATISKISQRARQIFKSAVRKQICDRNPFADIKCGSQQNDARQRFVTRETIATVIEECPDAQWRLIVALARYGGVRTPSETLRLRWQDIDWHERRMIVTSPKTKRYGKPSRVVPIFPELLPFLQESFEQAEEGAEFVISRYQTATCNVRAPFQRILRRAGVKPWPRLFQNLRASRETELANDFPLHVVTAWLGNTPRVADKHYLQVTPEHFDRAIGSKGGATGGARVVQQVVQKAAAATCNGRQQSQEASGVMAKNAENPKALDTCGVALVRKELAGHQGSA